MIDSIGRTLSNTIFAGMVLVALAFAAPSLAGDAPGENAPYTEQADYLLARLPDLERDIGNLRAKADGASGGEGGADD